MRKRDEEWAAGAGDAAVAARAQPAAEVGAQLTAAVGTTRSPAATAAAGAMVAVGPATKGVQDDFRWGREAAAARVRVGVGEAARALAAVGVVATAQGHAGTGAAQTIPDQGADHRRPR